MSVRQQSQKNVRDNVAYTLFLLKIPCLLFLNPRGHAYQMAMDSSSLLLASLDRCRRRKSRRRPLRPLPRQQAGGGTPSSGVDLRGPDRRDRLVLNHDPITGQGSILQFLPKSGLAG